MTNKDDLTKENAKIKQVFSATATNANHRYPRERDQNEYKFTCVEGTS